MNSRRWDLGVTAFWLAFIVLGVGFWVVVGLLAAMLVGRP